MLTYLFYIGYAQINYNEYYQHVYKEMFQLFPKSASYSDTSLK